MENDCSIDLLLGACTPRDHLFPLSVQHSKQKMRTSLHPSSSPTGTGFFFVDKTDKSRSGPALTIVDGTVTIEGRYQLPLISSAFELLRGVFIFIKLDLRNIYHLEKVGG